MAPHIERGSLKNLKPTFIQGTKLGHKAGSLSQYLFDFVFLLCIPWLLKLSELITLPQHIEERNQVVSKLLGSLFHRIFLRALVRAGGPGFRCLHHH